MRQWLVFALLVPTACTVDSSHDDHTGPSEHAETPDSESTGSGSTTKPYEGTAGTMSKDGERSQGSVIIEKQSSDDLIGTLPSSKVGFSAHRESDGSTTAHYFSGNKNIVIHLGDRESGTGSIAFAGETIDGHGSISKAQEEALNTLTKTPLGVAIMQVPLQLGCRLTYLSNADERAALVLPWQILLKHQPGFADVRKAEAQSECKYFGDLAERPTGLALDNEWPFPHVFGYYPFDWDLGAVAGLSQGIKDSSFTNKAGDCHSKCRHACGADCDPASCDLQEIAIEQECDNATAPAIVSEKVTTYVCGVEPGCRKHDDCYDACLDDWGCFLGHVGSVGPCLRSCDLECIDEHSFAECNAWRAGHPAQGAARFSSYETMRDADPSTREVSGCTSPPSPTCPTNGVLEIYSGSGASCTMVDEVTAKCVYPLARTQCAADVMKCEGSKSIATTKSICSAVEGRCMESTAIAACPADSSICVAGKVETTTYDCVGSVCLPDRTTESCPDPSLACDGNAVVTTAYACSSGVCEPKKPTTTICPDARGNCAQGACLPYDCSNDHGQLCFGFDRPGTCTGGGGIGVSFTFDGIPDDNGSGGSVRDLNGWGQWCPFLSGAPDVPVPDKQQTSVTRVPAFCGDHTLVVAVDILDPSMAICSAPSPTWPVTISNNGIYPTGEMPQSNIPTYYDSSGAVVSKFIFDGPELRTYKVSF